MKLAVFAFVFVASGLGCAGNPCTRATDRVVERLEACSIAVGADVRDDSEQLDDAHCTDEAADEHERVAQCTEQASCAALKGGAGADAYARCLTGS